MPTAVLKFTSVTVTSRYGKRILNGHENFHKGVDTGAGYEYPHSSFGAGRVKFAGRRPGGHPDYERGIHVIVEHAPGIDTSYHSLSRLNVKTGQQIPMGHIVGWAGKSAVGAKFAHVHNGLWFFGIHVDPLKYLTPGKAVRVTVGDFGPLLPSTPAGNGADPIGEVDVRAFKEVQSKVPNSIASKARAEKARGKGKWWRLWLGKDQKHSDILAGMKAVGQLGIILHLRGKGLTAGESFDVRCVRVTKGVESPHYSARVHGTPDGTFEIHIPFSFSVAAGAQIYVDVLGTAEAELSFWGASITNYTS